MIGQFSPLLIDSLVSAAALLIQLLLGGAFLARASRRRKTTIGLGLASVWMGLPLLLAVVVNAATRRAWWTVVLPLPMAGFCLLEYSRGYILRWKVHTRVLGLPYVLFYFLGAGCLVSYGFAALPAMGVLLLAVTLANFALAGYCLLMMVLVPREPPGAS